ncbi:MAG: DJ-1/PfpI family protein [Ardenticatenaceae bacterium]
MIEKNSQTEKPRKKKIYYKPSKYIFVLWGYQFEPLPATIFVSELRKLGLRVKIVSPSVQKMTGNYGFALYHDMTLSKALEMTDKVSGVIVPCGYSGALRLRNDPRAYQLFESVRAPILIGHIDQSRMDDLGLFPNHVIDDLIMYPENEDLIDFVPYIAHQLWITSDDS